MQVRNAKKLSRGSKILRASDFFGLPTRILRRLLMPLHLAAFVFVIVSMLLQAGLAYGAASQPGTGKATGTALVAIPNKPEESFVSALDEVRRLVETKPGSPELRNAQRKALRIAEYIYKLMDAKIDEARLNPKLTLEQKQRAVTDIQAWREWTQKEMDRANIVARGLILIDPSKAGTPDNVASLEFSSEAGSRAANERFRNMGLKGLNAATHFTTQYATFAACSFLMATAQLAFISQNNPVALEQWLSSTGNITGMVGFGLFMAVNHPVAKMLDGVMKGTIPRFMLPLIAMSAGSLASTMFHDLVADTDLQKCTKGYLSLKGRDQASCDKAFDNWVVTNKIIQYTPSMMSMVASQAIADTGRIVITQALAVRGAKNVTSTFRGLSILPVGRAAGGLAANAARSATTVASTGFTPMSFMIGGAQFMAFLVIDSFISEPIIHAKETAMIADFNLKTWFDKVGFHREYSRPPEGASQLIANAFDVEATDLKSAHQYLMSEYANLAKLGWQKPEDANKCVSQEIAARKIPGFWATPTSSYLALMPAVDYLFRGARVLMYSKSNEQLRCEVLARPGELFNRYAEKNKAWREHLLSAFAQKQNTWYQMIGQFTEGFQASFKLTQYLADARFKMLKDPSAPRPDLSREALAAVITGQPANPNELGPRSAQGYYVGSTHTPLLVDHTIAALACGIRPEESSRARTGLMSRVFNRIMKVYDGASSQFIQTRLGTSFSFAAPNITTGDGSICDTGVWDNDAGRFAVDGMPDYTTADVFRGQFRDRATGQIYEGLANYVFDNLSDDVWKSTGQYSNFPTYWDKTVSESVEKVWQKYAESYAYLVKKDFLPVAMDRSFKKGCPTETNGANSSIDTDVFDPLKSRAPGRNQPEVNCQDSAVAYRVGNGVMLSVELEIRNYLRGLFSMHASLYPDRTELKGANAKFVEHANELISSIAGLKPENFHDEDLSSLLESYNAHVSAISDLIEARLNSLQDPEASFRRETLKQLTGMIKNLVTELGENATIVKMMNFEDASTRMPVKKMGTPKSNDPFNRGSNR